MSRRTPTPLRLALALTGLGFALSTALLIVHARTHLVPSEQSFCAMTQTLDCAAVAASHSAIFLGLPWALWGLVGFLSIGAAAWLRSRWLLPLTLLAALVSLALLLVSVLQVGSICLLCEATHLTTWVLCFVAFRERNRLTGQLLSPVALQAIFVIPASIALAAWLFVPRYWMAFSYKGEPPFATGTTADGHPWIGAAEPTFTFEEYTDYGCPYCRIGSARMLRRLAKEPGWRLIRRQTSPFECFADRPSCEPMRAAFCAQEQGKFWRADRWLFAHYRVRKPIDREQLVADLALDAPAFEACMESPATAQRAAEQYRAARQAKVVDTPTYIVDTQRLRPKAFWKLAEDK